MGVPTKLLNLIETLYKEACCRVGVNGHLTEEVRVRSCVRQG